MTDIERLQRLNITDCVNGRCLECDLYDVKRSCNEMFKESINNLIRDLNSSEQRVIKLAGDNGKLQKIVNILCDTISQLIE